MIVQTFAPYRVSFAGGGTDLPEFFRDRPGAVLSTTIREGIHISMLSRFEPGYRIAYMQTEECGNVDEIQHDLAREAIRLFGIDSCEIHMMGDVPGGSGLGSSSACCVALCLACSVFTGERPPSKTDLFTWATQLEMNMLGRKMGLQDQAAASYGGLNLFEFVDSSVPVRQYPVQVSGEFARHLSNHCLLVFTGQTRKASLILEEQAKETPNQRGALEEMAGSAREMMGHLQREDIGSFSDELRENWTLKKSLVRGLTTARAEHLIDWALGQGCWAGKLLGAGGGGFLLLVGPPSKLEALKKGLKHRHMPLRMDTGGATHGPH